MSSHHFVKEGQEPALLILDAEAIPFEKIQELLEWNPTVIVDARSLEVVLGWGIKFDVVLTEHAIFEKVKLKLTDFAPVKVIGYPQGDNALQTAFQFLSATRQNSVHIVSRAPEDIFYQELNGTSNLRIAVFAAGIQWSLINNGHYEKWLPAGTSVIAKMADGEEELRAEIDGILKINRPGKFWVGEQL